MHPVSRPRLALAMMLGVYPIITALVYLLFPLTPDWPIFARTALLVPIMVLSVVYLVTPAVHRLAGRWLRPEPARCEDHGEQPVPTRSFERQPQES